MLSALFVRLDQEWVDVIITINSLRHNYWLLCVSFLFFSFFLFSSYSRSDRQAVPSLKQTGSQEQIFVKIEWPCVILLIKINYEKFRTTVKVNFFDGTKIEVNS